MTIAHANHHRGYPDFIGHAADFDAVEVPRHDADDGESVPVDEESLTDDVRIAVVNSLPESISDDGNRVAVCHGVFVGRKKAAKVRPQSEHREVAA